MRLHKGSQKLLLLMYLYKGSQKAQSRRRVKSGRARGPLHVADVFSRSVSSWLPSPGYLDLAHREELFSLLDGISFIPRSEILSYQCALCRIWWNKCQSIFVPSKHVKALIRCGLTPASCIIPRSSSLISIDLAMLHGEKTRSPLRRVTSLATPESRLQPVEQLLHMYSIFSPALWFIVFIAYLIPLLLQWSIA